MLLTAPHCVRTRLELQILRLFAHLFISSSILSIFRVTMASSTAMDSPRVRSGRWTNKRTFSDRE